MIGAVLALGVIVVWLIAVFDVLTADPAKTRLFEKGWWALIVLALNVVGAIGWFMFGRPRVGVTGAQQRTEAGESPFGRNPFSRDADDTNPSGFGGFGRSAGPRPPRNSPPRRPIAPDDDPDFLRSLGNNK